MCSCLAPDASLEHPTFPHGQDSFNRTMNNLWINLLFIPGLTVLFAFEGNGVIIVLVFFLNGMLGNTRSLITNFENMEISYPK